MEEKYDLLEMIEEDGFGNTYKAKLKNTEELRAMKIIDKKKMIEKCDEDFFLSELSKSLENMEICYKDNINSLKLYEYCNNEKALTYITELADENLANFLKKRNKGLSPQEILGILKQLNNTFRII